jgi:hypothetical protein
MLVQSQQTCWLYTILNGFLLSSNGQKLLYKNLLSFERSLTSDQRANFYSNANTCPGSNLTKINRIMFWKFFDRYMCALGGPRNAPQTPRKSANLLAGVSAISPGQRQVLLKKGGVGISELPKILRHLGMANFSIEKMNTVAHGRASDEFIIVDMNNLPVFVEPVLYKGRSRTPYDLAFASVVIGDSTTSHYHAICAYRVYDQCYIFDSNFGGRIYKVNWLKDRTMLKAAQIIAAQYPEKIKQLNYLVIDYAVYTNRRALQGVAPACRRPVFNKVKSVLNKAPTKSEVAAAVRNMRNSGYVIQNQQVKNYLEKRFPAPLARRLFD